MLLGELVIELIEINIILVNLRINFILNAF